MSVSAASPSTPEGPSSPSAPEGRREDDRAMGDRGCPRALQEVGEDLDGFRTRRDGLRDFGRAEAGDVTGKSLPPLRCHTGTDTLPWAHRGAAQPPTPATAEPSYEIVCTGLGALCWLPDLGR
ncbi:hypothetical protein ABZV75_13880 [Streptomyces flaveolus]